MTAASEGAMRFDMFPRKHGGRGQFGCGSRAAPRRAGAGCGAACASRQLRTSYRQGSILALMDRPFSIRARSLVSSAIRRPATRRQ